MGKDCICGHAACDHDKGGICLYVHCGCVSYRDEPAAPSPEGDAPTCPHCDELCEDCGCADLPDEVWIHPDTEAWSRAHPDDSDRRDFTATDGGEWGGVRYVRSRPSEAEPCDHRFDGEQGWVRALVCSSCHAVKAVDHPPALRSAPPVQPEPVPPMSAGSTHAEGCWRWAGHHECAITEIERLASVQGNAREALERLTKDVPAINYGGDFDCGYCGNDYVLEGHEDDCPWEAARRALATTEGHDDGTP